MRSALCTARVALASLVFAAVTASAAALAAETADLEVVARNCVREIVDGKYDAAVERFSPELKRSLGRDQLAILLDAIRAARQPARSVIPRLRHDQVDGTVQYLVKGNWSRGPASDFKVTLDKNGTVVGLSLGDEVKPQDEAALERYEPHNRLGLPFRGSFVARNAAHDNSNPHWVAKSQRYAVDFVKLEGNKSYRGEGKKLEDYPAYGQDALAAAAGTVVSAVDGVPDNAPGNRDLALWPAGNTVVIDLGHDEYAVYFHLQPGLAVKAGDVVKAGQPVGKIGASGAAGEPMLHFQLSDKARFGEGASLPARFSDVTLDGKKAAHALAVEGSRLSD